MYGRKHNSEHNNTRCSIPLSQYFSTNKPELFNKPIENLILITTAINIENLPLQHYHIRSILPIEERFTATLEGLESIRKVIPNTVIILVDVSHHPLSEMMTTEILTKFDGFFNLQSNPYCEIYSKCPDKGLSEVISLFFAVSWILETDLKFTRCWKVASRSIFDKFNYDEWIKDSFCKWVARVIPSSNYGMSIDWVVFSIAYEGRHQLLMHLIMLYMDRFHNFTVDIEHSSFDYIPADQFKIVEKTNVIRVGAETRILYINQ
jgi:hypothetical protein